MHPLVRGLGDRTTRVRQHELLIANRQAQIVRMDAVDTDIAFGLCERGMGAPELGLVCLREIRELRGASAAGLRAGGVIC